MAPVLPRQLPENKQVKPIYKRGHPMSDQSNSGEGVELLCGYSTKKVMASAGLALVLHVVVIAGYVVLGSSKKLKTAETAEAKPAVEKAKPDGKPGTKDDKAPSTSKTDKPA